MASSTRRSARLQDSTTASTAGTPIFSRVNSAANSPPTSDDEQSSAGKGKGKAATRASKRKAVSDSDDLDGDDDDDAVKRPPPKRRATVNRAFVHVPARKAETVVSKGKGKAPVRPKASAPVDEDEDSQLEYDESRSVYKSDSSSDEFVDSGASASEDEASDEEVMLNVAVANSLATRTGQGSSSRKPTPAQLRAAAAERRLRAGGDVDVDDSAMLDSDGDEDESDASDVPLKQLKGKSKVASSDAGRIVTLGSLAKGRRDSAKEKNAFKKLVGPEERALKKKLGRKLTHAEKTTIALHTFHPELVDVWGDLEANIAVIEPRKSEQPPSLKLTLLPFQRESLYWMQQQERGIWHGGMLADEMGMGKTIQMISLLISDGNKPNLIIAPTVAIMQWRNEIQTHTDGMKVLVWHGASRENDIKELKKYDVVLSTYSVVESSFRKQEKGFERQKGNKRVMITQKSPIHQIEWNRIILDEAHNIKERSTNTAKAAFELKSKYRWCLSGTPLQNRVGELYSLVRFLGGDPFSFYFCKRCDCKSLHWRFQDKRSCDDCGHSPMQHTCFWNNEILTPIQNHGFVGPGKPAFKKLKILLDRMMLRRTKLQRADDLGLPPRTVIVRRDYFSPEEKELYLSLFSDAKRQFNTYLDSGTVLNNYSNIFSLLTRMRQMACHPDLVIRSKTNANKFIQDQDEGTVCRLCNDVAEDAIQSRCRHIFDRECIRQYMETDVGTTPACPVCHLPLTIDLEAPALDLGENQVVARQGILGRLDLASWRSSTKIEALLEELTNLRLEDATTKSLVFSQFVSFLDLIAYRLQRAGFKICRLEGTMSPQARDATIQHFMNNVDVTVFLVSLKAGGVALNLTEASRVYLMDSWWNPAVEFQAMDRIHRLGQHRPVKAIKLVVEDSIESRIVQLQDKKAAMVDATLSPDETAMGRLTPEDLQFLFRL